jgi:hypothetical protein
LQIEHAFDVYSIEELYDMTDMDLDEVDEDIMEKGESFLNKDCRRNSENTYHSDFNCGGYALNTFNWYKPYEGAWEWREKLLYCWLEDYYDQDGLIAEPSEIIKELENRLVIRDTLYMLRQFKGRLRRVEPDEELWEGERLIAYRVGFEYWFDEVEQNFIDIDIDFHYRFYDKEFNVWFEKMGSGDIRVCNDDTETDDYWIYPYWKYGSNIIYLALQM